ncbi:Hypothetical protein HVR_LOCUS1354 [uncultured virus]|nr:Hypothetical protein HVR_LOCUS1354 [uncultured virus]
MATRVIPAFLLRGLDPNKLLADYQSGYFSRPITAKTKITISQNAAILAPTYGTTNQSPIFCVKDRNNCSVIIATSGHLDYEIFTRTGGELPVGGRCKCCGEDFTHTAIGYPIAYQETTILTNDDPDPRNAHYRVLYSFYAENIRFCDFECALYYVRNILSRPADQRDTTLRDSERLLKLMYKLMYPTAPPLRAANDPELLISNHGSLTREQWKDSRHIYMATDRVLMIPTKREFIQQNFINPATPIDIIRDMSTVVAASS